MMPSVLPRVYLVTDAAWRAELVPRVARALAGLPSRAVAVQVRVKGAEGRELLALARALREVARRAGQLLLVNDRLDVALAAGADGVHLPSAGVPPAEARRLLGPGALVGASCHSDEEVRRARDGGADFATFGPVFETPSKLAYGPPVGLDRLRQAASLGLPIFGLGGVEARNAEQVLRAGAFGLAAIRSWLSPPEPEGAVRALLSVTIGAPLHGPQGSGEGP